MENQLVLHSGAHQIERGQLLAIETPDATSSFVPIPHHNLLAQVEHALSMTGLKVTGERHGVNKDGMEYFGILDVERTGTEVELSKGYIRTLGLRNAHNKRFPAIVGAGSRVFVCDNLAFSAEIQIARRHTTHIFRDLPALVARAIGLLASKWIDQDKRFDAYKQTEISDAEAHDVIVRALDFRVVGGTQIPHVLNEYRNPRHEEFKDGKTLWRLFNAFTETLKGNYFAMPKRTQALHGLFDQKAGLVIDVTPQGYDKELQEGLQNEEEAEVRIQ